MNFLQQAIIETKKEVERQKKKVSLDKLRAEAKRVGKKRSLKKAIQGTKPIGLIAEIKLHSPFDGRITNLEHKEIARAYAKSKADAISVITNKTFFDADISFIKDVRKIAKQPVLRKDFIIDPYQIHETAASGADAMLLIVAALTQRQLKEFLGLAKKLRLDCLVEAHTEKEIERAVEAGAEIIGINNRSLKTLKLDLKRTEELLQFIPSRKLVISESGIDSPEEVEDLGAVGVDGVLVGAAILKAKDPVKKIAELKGERQK